MKTFKYVQPQNLKEASKELGKNWQESLPYAGGTDLYGMLKHHIIEPRKIVNLKSIQNLDKISYDSRKGLTIGSLVNISEVAESDLVGEKYPVLAQAAGEVASPQLRNMGTIGGNICQRPRCWYFRGEFDCLRKGGELCYAVDGENKYHCIIGGGPCFIVHPSDTAVALLALDAEVTIFNGSKFREIPFSQFFVLPDKDILRENILKPGDIITEIRIPTPPAGTTSAYIKVKERGAWDFAIVSVAAVLKKSGNTIENGKIVYGGIAPIPWFESNAYRRLKNMAITRENIQQLSQEVLTDALPLEKNDYKLILARNITQRIIEQLAIE